MAGTVRNGSGWRNETNGDVLIMQPINYMLDVQNPIQVPHDRPWLKVCIKGDWVQREAS